MEVKLRNLSVAADDKNFSENILAFHDSGSFWVKPAGDDRLSGM